MAVPTLTANSPSAGYIAWNAFSIAYGGVTYSVPSDSTNKKFVYWLYNAGAPTLNYSDTLPDLAPDDLLLFLNKNGIPVNAQAASVLDGSLIVSGSILADAIGANAITADKLAANVLSAGFVLTGKLQVGTATWTPTEGLIIPGVAIIPGGPTSQTLQVTGSPTGGFFQVNYNGAFTPPIAYNAAGATGITQTITIFGAPTGGTFTITANNLTTSPIAYNASTGTVQTAVRTLGGVWATATVTGSAGAWVVTPSAVGAALRFTPSFTGGTAPQIDVVLPNLQVAIQTLGGVWANAVVTGSAGGPWTATATGGTTPLLTSVGNLTGGTSPNVSVIQGEVNATITANVTAKSLTVQKDFNLLGTTNFIRGTVNLASGVTRPTIAPTVYQTWPLIGSHSMPFGSIDYGLTNHLADSTILLTAQGFFGGGIATIYKSNGQYGYPAAAGDNNFGVYRAWCVNFNVVGGITTAGGAYFVAGSDTTRSNYLYIYKLDSSFNKVGEIAVQALLPSSPGRSTIGHDDSGNIILATASSPNSIRLLFWNTSLAYVGYRDYATFTGIGSTSLNYVGESNYDMGALRDVISVESIANFVCDTSGNRLGDAYAFSPSNGGVVRGMWYDGTRFWSYTADGSLYKHGRNPQPQTITVSYSWADRNASGGAHQTEETTTPTSFIQSGRTWINVQTPLPPDSGSSNTDAANRVGIYAAAGAGSRVLQTQVGPAGADAGYLAADDGTGKSATTCTWEQLVTGTAAPQGSNGFVGVTGTGGGILKSAAATTGSGIILNGDGSGQIGRTMFAADGSMSGAGMESFLTPNSAGNMNVTSSLTDIPGLTRTLTVPAGGGTYVIGFDGWLIPAAGHTVLVSCFVDTPWTTQVGGSAVGSSGTNASVSFRWRVTLTAGTHTIKLRAVTAAAGQTGVIAGGANSQMWMQRCE